MRKSRQPGITPSNVRRLNPADLPRPRALADQQARLAENILALSDKFLAPLHARFNSIVATVAAGFGFSPDDLKRSNQAVMPARRAAVVLAVEFLNPPLNREVLSDWFGISEATLYRFQRQVRAAEHEDAAFAARLAALREALRAARDKEKRGKE